MRKNRANKCGNRMRGGDKPAQFPFKSATSPPGSNVPRSKVVYDRDVPFNVVKVGDNTVESISQASFDNIFGKPFVSQSGGDCGCTGGGKRKRRKSKRKPRKKTTGKRKPRKKTTRRKTKRSTTLLTIAKKAVTTAKKDVKKVVKVEKSIVKKVKQAERRLAKLKRQALSANKSVKRAKKKVKTANKRVKKHSRK